MSEDGIGKNLTQFERNKYFYGKLMTVRDFETEQSYFNEKRHLLNWLIHGIGVVCGLEVREPEIDNRKLKIKLSPGVAIDCCGREIVVGKEFAGKELEVKEKEHFHVGSNYIYLKYKECEKETVSVLANVSSCEEVCCDNRVEEVFELELGAAPVNVTGNVTESDETHIKGALVEALQNGIVKGITITDNNGDYTLMLSSGTYDIRTSASGYDESEVRSDIATPKSGVDFVLDKETEPKDSKELWEDIPQEYYEEHLKSCPECDDPKVLLAVIDYNDDGTLTINPETYKYRAMVYNNPMLYELISTHIVDFNNPHRTTAEQAGALVSVDGVNNPGGDVDFKPESGSAITITPDDDAKTITIGENHSVRTDNPHEVTADDVRALKSVNNVGNVDEEKEYVNNIDLESTDETIGIDAKPDDNKIDLKVNDGSINDEKIAEEANINEGKIRHLTLVYENLKERSLKCIVDSFMGIYNKFEVDAALEIVGTFKDALTEVDYQNDEEYIRFITETSNLFQLLKNVGVALDRKVPDESLEEYIAAVRELGVLFGQDEIIPVEIASAIEEVCFYARWLAPHEPAHVVDINWNHNGDTLLEDIGVGGYKIVLNVTFDKEIRSATINEHTFLVRYKRDYESDTFDYIWLKGDIDTTGEYTQKAMFIAPYDKDYRNKEFTVVLKGDFIVDRDRRALDGNFIGGELPSGNGYQGGDFESWFRLTSAAEDTTCISGKLFRKLKGKQLPYPNASITVYKSGTEDIVAKGSSDAKGVYCIDSIPTKGTVDIIVEEQLIDGEYKCKKAEMTKIDTGTTPGSCSDEKCIEVEDIIAECSLITARTCISGKVVRTYLFTGEEPLPGASVTVTMSGTKEVIAKGSTDASGVYCIDNIPLEIQVDIFVERGEHLYYKAEMKDIDTGTTPGNCSAGNCVEIVKLIA